MYKNLILTISLLDSFPKLIIFKNQKFPKKPMVTYILWNYATEHCNWFTIMYKPSIVLLWFFLKNSHIIIPTENFYWTFQCTHSDEACKVQWISIRFSVHVHFFIILCNWTVIYCLLKFSDGPPITLSIGSIPFRFNY